MIVGVIDAIRGLFDVDVEKDDAATEPYIVQPDRLYVFPLRAAPQQVDIDASEGGFFDDATLRVRLLYTLGNRGEPRAIKADRDLSIALDAAAKAAIATLEAATVWPPGSGSLWHHLVIEQFRPDYVRTFTARGFALDVAFMLSEGAKDATATSSSG